jgi:hypothetical protein
VKKSADLPRTPLGAPGGVAARSILQIGIGIFVDALADSIDSDTDFDKCFSSDWGKASLALNPMAARLIPRDRRLAR